MRAPTRFIATAVLASTVGTACVAARMTTARPAEASAAHKYTLRIGDKVAIPAISQVCSVYVEGGAVELFCARARHARHQVTIFRDSILVWKAGNPDPVWSGKS